MTQLRVTLAGALSLQRGAHRVSHRSFGGNQLPIVTATFVLHRRRPVAVEALAGQLWGDTLPDQWRVAIRGLVSRLRHVLGDVGYADDVIVATTGTYRARLGRTEVDVERVPHQLAQARVLLDDGDIEAARDQASAARQVASRPVLEGIDAPILTELRRDLTGQRMEALDLLAECRLLSGEHAAAITAAQEAIRLDPFRETSWRHLLSAHAESGNVAVALRGYERMRRLFAEELGVDPSPPTQALHAELLRTTSPQDPDDRQVLELLPETPSNTDRVPYRGLLAFRPEDSDLFFGRDAHVQELIRRLADTQVVTVTGPSGSGKSSLVTAGLLPALTAGALPDADTWIVALASPGSDPLKSLAASLAELGDIGQDPVGRLWTDDDALADLARLLLASRGAAASSRLLLVIDQAEELFTACDDDAKRRRFVSVIARAVRGPDAPVRTVATIRADFVPQAATVPELAELLSTSLYVVPPLDGDGYEAAIVGPARQVGAKLEPGLVGRILADVAGEPGALPLLQHALLELWQQRDGATLSLAAYESTGGVTGALAHRAESVYQSLADDHQDVARRLLLRMVHPGEDTGDTRRRVALEEVRRDRSGADVVETVIDRMVEARLLTTGTDGSSEPVVEVAHEALITGWPRLASWIADAREDLLAHERLAQATNEWVSNDRTPAYLLRGTRLLQHEAWTAATTLQLAREERELIVASRAAEDAEAHAKQRRQRATISIVSATAVVALVLAGVALAARDNAAHQRDIAEARRLLASSGEAADADPELALLLALEAAERLPGDPEAAAALHGAAAANRTLLTATWPEKILGNTQVDMSDDGRLMAWAGQPGGVVELFDIDRREAIWSHDFADGGGDLLVRPRFVSQDRELLVTVQFSPQDESRATEPPAAAGVHVFDVDTGELVRTLPSTECGAWGAAPGIAWAAVVSEDGDDFVLWNQYASETIREEGCVPLGTGPATIDVVRTDVQTGEQRAIAANVEANGGHYWSALSHDGRIAAVDHFRGSRTVMDAVTGEVLFTLPGVAPDGPVTLSADGARVAFVSEAGEHRTEIYDVATGEHISTTTGHTDGVQLFTARFSIDGRWLYSTSADGTVRLWDVETGEELDRLSGFNAPAVEPRLSRDRTRLLTSTFTPTVHVLDLTPGGRPEIVNIAPCGPEGAAGMELLPGGLEVRGDRLMVHASCSGPGMPGRLHVLDRTTAEVLFDVPALGLMSAVSHDGRLIASQDWSEDGSGGTIVIHDAATGRRVTVLDGLCTWEWSALPPGAHTEGDYTDAEGPACLQPPTPPFAGFNQGFAISPDNRLVAVQTDTVTVHWIVVSDIATNSVLGVVPGDGATFAQERSELITYQHETHRLSAYSTDDLSLVREGPVLDLPFFEDVHWVPHRGEIVARSTRLSDARIYRFDVESLELISEMNEVHEAEVTDLAVNVAAGLLASGAADGRVRVWDLDTGELLHEVILGDTALAVALSEDGSTLYTGTTSAGIQAWILDHDQLIEFARSRVSRGFTDAECARYFSNSACPEQAI
ncbi:MAG: BTAD domain-containing putative transcriptional regulator [Nitriliruptorales bacterium]|nr:BTAD domain-containing putative transcriptional regulator [Nitriliruptorales bacterium]